MEEDLQIKNDLRNYKPIVICGICWDPEPKEYHRKMGKVIFKTIRKCEHWVFDNTKKLFIFRCHPGITFFCFCL